MRIVRTVSELRTQLAPARRAGRPIGLVPTMGAFHDGHLSLMRRARDACDVVVVSLFVNPAQFNETIDLELYPRDEERDAALAEGVGADLLFAPDATEVYPAGFATSVAVRGLTAGLEGAHRGHGHFDGVTTVVAKLLNMVGPDVAYFGQKDAQQVAVIRRLVRDLNVPARVEVCPTVRDADGLALSSRNVLLAPEERVRATSLSRALGAVHAAIASGERDADAAAAPGLAELAAAGVEPDYLAIVTADMIEPVNHIEGDVLVAVAARVGSVRLIDNVPITVRNHTILSTHNPVATPHGASTS